MLICFEDRDDLNSLRDEFVSLDWEEQQDFLHDEGTTEDSFVFRLAEELERDGGFCGSLVIVFDPKTRTFSKKEFGPDVEFLAQEWADDRVHEASFAGWR